MRKILLISCLCCQTVFGQNTSPDKTEYRKNVINGSYGPLYSLFGLEYERVFYLKDKQTKISTGVLVSYSPNLVSSEVYFAGPYVRLFFGKKSLHCEVDAGASVYYDHTEFIHTHEDVERLGLTFTAKRTDYMAIIPRIHAGLRYQNPRKLPVFRLGLGFPNLIYASVGVAF